MLSGMLYCAFSWMKVFLVKENIKCLEPYLIFPYVSSWHDMKGSVDFAIDNLENVLVRICNLHVIYLLI
jgi:hypothetical protein